MSLNRIHDHINGSIALIHDRYQQPVRSVVVHLEKCRDEVNSLEKLLTAKEQQISYLRKKLMVNIRNYTITLTYYTNTYH